MVLPFTCRDVIKSLTFEIEALVCVGIGPLRLFFFKFLPVPPVVVLSGMAPSSQTLWSMLLTACCSAVCAASLARFLFTRKVLKRARLCKTVLTGLAGHFLTRTDLRAIPAPMSSFLWNPVRPVNFGEEDSCGGRHLRFVYDPSRPMDRFRLLFCGRPRIRSKRLGFDLANTH